MERLGELGVCLERAALGHSSILGLVKDAIKPRFEVVTFHEHRGDNSPEGWEDSDRPCVSNLAHAFGHIQLFLGEGGLPGMLPSVGVLPPFLPSLEEFAVDVPYVKGEHGDFLASPAIRPGAATAHLLGLGVKRLWCPWVVGGRPRLGLACLAPRTRCLFNIDRRRLPSAGPSSLVCLRGIA